MRIWLDNHLSPALARWVFQELQIECVVVRDLGLARASDTVIFDSARAASDVIFVTKDVDFARLVEARGAPPPIVWLTCGNTSTAHLVSLLKDRLPLALSMIAGGERLVEIG